MMTEYGRGIQQMVEHCKSLAERSERQRCAESIVRLMASLAEKNGEKEDFMQKLWNHLAMIANYDLDIDYPVEIKQAAEVQRQRIPYPQTKIHRRHYGLIVEKFNGVIANMEDKHRREQLACHIANMMKRDLSIYNIDAMSDAKVADDLAEYTGSQELNPEHFQFITDRELISQLPKPAKKKRKK